MRRFSATYQNLLNQLFANDQLTIVFDQSLLQVYSVQKLAYQQANCLVYQHKWQEILAIGNQAFHWSSGLSLQADTQLIWPFANLALADTNLGKQYLQLLFKQLFNRNHFLRQSLLYIHHDTLSALEKQQLDQTLASFHFLKRQASSLANFCLNKQNGGALNSNKQNTGKFVLGNQANDNSNLNRQVANNPNNNSSISPNSSAQFFLYLGDFLSEISFSANQQVLWSKKIYFSLTNVLKDLQSFFVEQEQLQVNHQQLLKLLASLSYLDWQKKDHLIQIKGQSLVGHSLEVKAIALKKIIKVLDKNLRQLLQEINLALNLAKIELGNQIQLESNFMIAGELTKKMPLTLAFLTDKLGAVVEVSAYMSSLT